MAFVCRYPVPILSLFGASGRLGSMIVAFPGYPHLQSNFNGLNTFGTMEKCSSHGLFEPMKVIHGARSGSKYR